MDQKTRTYLLVPLLLVTGLACSLSGIRQQVSSAQQTANAVKTKVIGVATAGGELVDTAQAFETQGSRVMKTVKAIATKGAPLLSTLQAVVPDNPGLVQTAQAFIKGEVPSGEPPSDIPIMDPDRMESYFGSSHYIFYISQYDYAQVLDFYKLKMAENGWQYLSDDSHEYAQAAQLNYYKDTRTATIDLSLNSLNNTTLVIINILDH